MRAFVGAEMLAFQGPWAPMHCAATVEAITHSHLYCLTLRNWQSLCARFPEELGPISRGESETRKGRAGFHPAVPAHMRHLSRVNSSGRAGGASDKSLLSPRRDGDTVGE